MPKYYTSLRADTCSQTFKDVERLITLIVKNHLDNGVKFPCIDDAYAAAYVGYLKAFDSYKSEYGSFNNWLSRKIEYEYRECRRKLYRESARRFELTDVPAPGPKEFKLVEWLESLSEDAQAVACEVVFPSFNVRMLLADIGAQPDDMAELRNAVRMHFKECGWTKRRIAAAFSEIRKSL